MNGNDVDDRERWPEYRARIRFVMIVAAITAPVVFALPYLFPDRPASLQQNVLAALLAGFVFGGAFPVAKRVNAWWERRHS